MVNEEFHQATPRGQGSRIKKSRSRDMGCIGELDYLLDGLPPSTFPIDGARTKATPAILRALEIAKRITVAEMDLDTWGIA